MLRRRTPARRFQAAASLGAAAWLAVHLAAQTAPSIAITSPPDGSFVSGPVELEIRFDPASVAPLAVRVDFFADGKRVCRIERYPFDCEWDAGGRVIPHVIRAVATLEDGRRLVHTVRTRDPGYADVVDVDAVQITAVVTNERGEFVRGLSRQDFQVFEDDRPQVISNFASTGVPLELVVAVDVSGSMADAMAGLKASVASFLSHLPEHAPITLIGFNDNVFTLARKESRPEARSRAVRLLAPWGGTALYDAILSAFELLGRQMGRRALIVFTDGDDQNSHATMDSTILRAERSDATIYMISQGRGGTVPVLRRLIDRLAVTSGGRAFHNESVDELDRAFDVILEELQNQYLLSYIPVETTRDGQWHRITVKVRDGLSVRARQGYRALAPSK